MKDPVAQTDRALASNPKVASSILAGVSTCPNSTLVLDKRVDITFVLLHAEHGFEAML